MKLSAPLSQFLACQVNEDDLVDDEGGEVRRQGIHRDAER